jgi:hypothetical protein
MLNLCFYINRLRLPNIKGCLNINPYKFGPGQKFPWVIAGKNSIRHVIAYTLNIDKVMMI